jgi:hypothetical protein
MTTLKKGMRVKHLSKPEWGLGQLLEDESSQEIRVFFVNKGTVNLQQTARDKLQLVTGEDATSLHLDHMILPGGGSSRPMLNLKQAKESFLERFPGGFYGQRLTDAERHYKGELMRIGHALLGQQVLLDAIDAGDYQRVFLNANRLLSHQHNNLPSPYEKMAFRDGLQKLNDPKRFAVALLDYLHGVGALQSRFEAFASVLTDMEADKWPVITNFRFFLNPQTDVYIKPTNLQHAAELCQFEINYKPQINWLTYHSVMAFYQYLTAAIADLKPRDMVDVQSFIWCIDPNFQ